MKDEMFGKLIVPIVPDEGRTFGLQVGGSAGGQSSSEGQSTNHTMRWSMLLTTAKRRTARSWKRELQKRARWLPLPAGTAYSTIACPRFRSTCTNRTFGFQRIGDMAWAFADSRGQGLF